MHHHDLLIPRLLFFSIFLAIITNQVCADEYIGEEIYEKTNNTQFNFKRIIKAILTAFSTERVFVLYVSSEFSSQYSKSVYAPRWNK